MVLLMVLQSGKWKITKKFPSYNRVSNISSELDAVIKSATFGLRAIGSPSLLYENMKPIEHVLLHPICVLSHLMCACKHCNVRLSLYYWSH